ncbi:MAG: rhodanese-like domain-containing protein [Clostridia bacterium]|nr:rhodanese-like domain-containing protein [Clostridia bacterium]
MFKIFYKKRYNREGDAIEIEYTELKERVKTGAILLDVRSAQEYQEGHLEGAMLIPEYEIGKNIEKILQDKHQEIIVYCTSGSRSKKACRTMKLKGYDNLYDLKGGLDNI